MKTSFIRKLPNSFSTTQFDALSEHYDDYGQEIIMSSNNFAISMFQNTYEKSYELGKNLKVQTRQLILDTETTGFSPENGDRIVEVGIIELIDRKLTGNTFHVYLNPERSVGASQHIHGLSDDRLRGEPLFAEIADELEAFINGAEVIAHNAQFDMRFLDAELQSVGRSPLTERIQVTDSLILARKMFPQQKNTLDALAIRFNVKERDRTFHGALLDAEILADVYLQLTNV